MLKNSPKFLGHFCHFQKNCPKVNSCQIGANSPNLVTLISAHAKTVAKFEEQIGEGKSLGQKKGWLHKRTERKV
jgi:hypothetical protein